MADITIVKLKVRRGSDAQRKSIVLDQGEVGYTLDTQRLFVGDGTTYGGSVMGNRGIGPFASIASLGPAQSPGLQRGDIGYANSKLYMLTATNHVYTDDLSGFAYIGNVPDDTHIEFDSSNNLTVKKNPGALNAAYFSESFFGNGLLSSGDILQPDLNADQLELSGSSGRAGEAISLTQNSVTKRELASTAFTSPISKVNNEPVTLNINSTQFQIADNGQLEFTSLGTLDTGSEVTIDTRSWAGAIPGANLAGGGVANADTGVGPGIYVDQSGQLDVKLKDVEYPVGLNGGRVTLQGAESAATEFPFFDTRNGLIINNIQSSVFDVVTAYGLSGQANDGIPIGTILPHALAFTTIPGGYLLCDGKGYDGGDPTYAPLYKVIGQQYGAGSGASESFNVPNLSANQVLYGYGTDASSSAPSYYLSAFDIGTAVPQISATAVNYIIKYEQAPLLNIFNGCPNQVTQGFLGEPGTGLNQQVYECIDSSSERVELSSAGFITFALSGLVRNGDSPAMNGFAQSTFDKFAIPVFNY